MVFLDKIPGKKQYTYYQYKDEERGIVDYSDEENVKVIKPSSLDVEYEYNFFGRHAIWLVYRMLREKDMKDHISKIW